MKTRATIAAAAVTLALAGTAGAAQTTQTRESFVWPTQTRSAWNQLCTSDGTSYAYCGCVYRWLRTHVRYRTFLTANGRQQYRWAVRADSACAHLYRHEGTAV